MKTKDKIYKVVGLGLDMYRYSRGFRLLLKASATILLLLVVLGVFYSKQQLVVSYGSDNCVNNLTILPYKYQNKNGDKYKISYKPLLKIGKKPIIATKSCFSFVKVPSENTQEKVSLAFMGNSLISKSIVVKSPKYPYVNNTLESKTVLAVAEPIEFEIDQSDKTFEYSLKANDKRVECSKQYNKKIICDIKSLDLKHATVYNFQLSREFNGSNIQTVAKADVPTITPIVIDQSSISAGSIIFDNPKEIILNTDKDIRDINQVSLSSNVNNQKKNHKLSYNFKSRVITIKLDEELPRGMNFELKINQLNALDGGSLASEFILDFQTSNGPAVIGSNIRDRMVSPNQTISINFDQDLLANQDISKEISFEIAGRPANFSAQIRGRSIIVDPTGDMPRCTKFTIKIGNNIQSTFGITGHSGWSFSSRTICQEAFSIGYSANGRSITTYRFGSSPNVILYIGTTHGDEANTKWLLDKWINELEGNPEKIPVNRSIIVIPVLNPDGLASSSRLNGRGVDLNRNFPANNWKPGIIMQSGQFLPQGGGAEPLSEPESKAIANFIQSVNPGLTVTYHSKASVVIGNDSGNANSLASLYSSKSRYAYRTNDSIAGLFNYDTTGAFEDWLHDKSNKAAILVELASRNSDEFGRNLTALWLMAQSF
jgi:hypothetical protein